MEKKKEKDLKLIEFKIQDDEGQILGDLSLVSIVFDPAIEQGYHLFGKEKSYQFSSINDEKQILIGPAMIPNKHILRYDHSTDTYFNCWFSEDTVRKCSELFFKNSNHTKTNLEHGELLGVNQVNGAYVCQSWIVENPEMDTAKAYGFSPAKGDWYLGFKIENSSLWNVIKETGLKAGGFSVEGVFTEKFFNLFNKEKETEKEIFLVINDDSLSDLEKENKIRSILF